MLPTFMPRIEQRFFVVVKSLTLAQQLCGAVGEWGKGKGAWQQPVDLSAYNTHTDTDIQTVTLIFILEKSHFAFAFHLVSFSFLSSAPLPAHPLDFTF